MSTFYDPIEFDRQQYKQAFEDPMARLRLPGHCPFCQGVWTHYRREVETVDIDYGNIVRQTPSRIKRTVACGLRHELSWTVNAWEDKEFHDGE